MNLRDELERMADNAPPLSHDAADRALKSARRHRRYIQVPLLAAAITLAILGGLVIRPALVSIDLEPAAPWKEDTEVPALAQPLPAKGVSKARLAYVRSCGSAPEITPACVESRIMTPDNKHWVIPDASPTRDEKGKYHEESITVSPNGRLIVYTRENWLVLRNLASSKVTPLFELATRASPSETTRYERAVWSPDSTEVAFALSVGSNWVTKLVDATTGEVKSTLDNGWLLGLPEGDAPIPIVGRGGGGDVRLVDRTGARRGSIPRSVLRIAELGIESGMTSADGSKAIFVLPVHSDVVSTVRVIEIDPSVLVSRFDSGLGGVGIMGWIDDRRILLDTETLGPEDEPRRVQLDVFDLKTGKRTMLTALVAIIAGQSVSVATDLL